MKQRYCPYCMSAVGVSGRCPACGLTAGTYVPLPHHLPPGTTLHDGRYLVGRALGNGGFGITYIGRDLTLGPKVAIKEYFPDGRAMRYSSTVEVIAAPGIPSEFLATERTRFIREAQTLAVMEKLPVVVGVRDVFEENGTAYLVMEYVEGETLAQAAVREGGRIEPNRLLDLVRPLFSALGRLHTAGLLHRDISPDNLMLEDGRIRLIDFGCAREGNATQGASTELKEGYAPVEQYVGQGYGPWTDVYALCATLYKCLTGTTPPSALDRIAIDELVAPRDLGVNITSRQEKALLRGLSIQARRRFRSMAQLEAALYGEVPESGDDVRDNDVPANDSMADGVRNRDTVENTQSQNAQHKDARADDKPERTDQDPNPNSEPDSWRRVAMIAALVALCALAAVLLVAHPWESTVIDEEAKTEAEPVRDSSAYEELLSQDLEAQFADAYEVRSYDDLQKAVRAGKPAKITKDTQLDFGNVTVPVLIPKGVTLSGPPVNLNATATNEAEQNKAMDNLTFNALVVNLGTLRGNLGVSASGQIVNHGTIGSEDDIFSDCRIACRGTIVNDGEIFAATESSLSDCSTLYNAGRTLVSTLFVQDDADVYNRGELRVCGSGQALIHTSSKPLFNERGANFGVSSGSSLGEGAYICNWGDFQVDKQGSIGASIIQNEGHLTGKNVVKKEDLDKCVLFGHGSIEAAWPKSNKLFDLSGTDDGDASTKTIETVQGTMAQVSTSEELLAALASSEVAGVVLVQSVEVGTDLQVDKPLSIEGDGQLEMTHDAKLVVRGCEVRLSGKTRALETNDIELVEGACLWGGGLNMAHESTFTLDGSIANLYDPLAEDPANDLSSSAAVLLNNESVLLWSFAFVNDAYTEDANDWNVQVKGGSALAVMGRSSLDIKTNMMFCNKTRVDVGKGSIFLRGIVTFSHASVTMAADSAWYEQGGKLEVKNASIELGGTSRFQDSHLWLNSQSSLHVTSTCSMESFGASDSYLRISSDSILTNDDKLTLQTNAVSLDGKLVNNGDLYMRKGIMDVEEEDRISGDGDVIYK